MVWPRQLLPAPKAHRNVTGPFPPVAIRASWAAVRLTAAFLVLTVIPEDSVDPVKILD